MPRKFKLAVLHAARFLGLFKLARLLTGSGVRILCYHGTWLADASYRGDEMFIKRDTFTARLADLRQRGYQVVPLSHAIAGLRGQAHLPRAPVVITIDDGWYSTYAEMVPVLRSARMHATLYFDTAQLLAGRPIVQMIARYIHILAGRQALSGASKDAMDRAMNGKLGYQERWDATMDLARHLNVDPEPLIKSRTFDYMSPNELREAFATDVLDVQLHTHNHTLGDQSFITVRSELEANAEALAALLGAPPTHFRHFCYPSGVSSASAEAALDQLGIASSTGLARGLAFPGGALQALPRFVDGDHLDRSEFEAELSGFRYLCLKAFSSLKSLLRWRATEGPALATG
jgi:peptidoglycan/xylan/chitin deacetylase (PgdA/CDA1 family)